MNRFIHDEYRILSFDPGSRKLGMSVQTMDLDTMDSLVIHAETLTVDSYLEPRSETYAIHGEFTDRLAVIRDYVYQSCKAWGPAAIVIELPYLGRRPQAYGALKDVLLTIRQGCHQWNRARPPFLYEPSVVKRAANVPGNSGDKSLMLKALLDHPHIRVVDTLDITKFDEHAIDAILIGRAHIHVGIQKKEQSDAKKKKSARRKRRAKKRK